MVQHILSVGFEERERARIVDLLRAYETSIGISLCFQGFEAELAGLPGDYAPPGGQMLLARHAAGGDLIGCVAVRAVADTPGLCEMKRLYVSPAARGQGLGRRLALAIMDEARGLGYARMGLDTLPTLREAQALYRSLGFRETGMSSSVPPVLMFERELAP